MTTLTDHQRLAIESCHQKIVCIAGPGSGKTTVLVGRIAKLIAAGTRPDQIAAVTFTNAAAREIEKRLPCPNCGGMGYTSVELGPKHMSQVQCDCHPPRLAYAGTLHGLMLRVIKTHGTLIGFGLRVSVMDEEVADKFLEQVISDLQCAGMKKEIRHQIDKGPGPFLFGPELSTQAMATLDEPTLVAREFYQRMLKANLLDFDSVLKFGLVVLQRLAASGDTAPMFEHLLWDEFQDSGADDAAIFHALPARNKFVVGDPDQSIYGFRGGDPRYLMELAKAERVEWTEIFLEENFRCDQAIAESADRLIFNNPFRLAKTNKSMTGLAGKIWTFKAATEEEEMAKISEDINLQGDPNGCAVLVRSNALADRFSKGLQAHGVAIHRRERVDRPSDWTAMRSLVNLLSNPENDQLAFWWIAHKNGMKAAKMAQLKALSEYDTINRTTLRLPVITTIDALPAALAVHGIGQESIALVNQAVALLPAGATLGELSFALGDDELHRKEVGEGVTITTIHSAKGREWESVYLPAFEDGTIPVLSKNSSIEEERRVVFVAITRAKRRLVVSFAQKRRPAFGGRFPEPTTMSRFVNELREMAAA